MTSTKSTTSTTRTTVRSLETTLNGFMAAQTEHNAQVLDLIAALAPSTAKSAVKGTKATTKATTKPATKASKGKGKTGLTFKEQQAALKVLKAEGKAVAGMTVKQAIEAGLLGATFTPERTPKATATKAAKGKTTKAKATEGTPFPVLKAALKAHKASGAIPAQHNGTYVSVRSAITDGLMNADGTLPGTKAKAPKATKAKAKGAQVVAVASDATPAYEAPRRADGTITPKREWALREQLAETGKFDRYQIDKRVAKAVRKGLI